MSIGCERFAGRAIADYYYSVPRHSILDKLQKALTRPISSEDQVVYILVEIRKLIDLQNEPSLMSLKLYCDWAVHTELTYASRTRPILTLVDDDLFNCFHPKGHGTSPEDNEKLQRLLYLDAVLISYSFCTATDCRQASLKTTRNGSISCNTTRT